ncbi:MAG: ABC transporter permease [Polaromonas sp.]|nr:ABC transporter permease [Polaromonas sp.]
MTAKVTALGAVPRRLSPLQWVGLAVAIVITGLGVILGLWQKLPVQHVIFYAVATFALVIWIWNTYLAPGATRAISHEQTPESPSGMRAFRHFLRRHRGLIIALLLMLGAFVIASAVVTEFFSVLNVVTFLVLVALLIFTVQVSQLFVDNRSAFIGLMVLATMFAVGSLFIDGFSTGANIKSMLLFASFLGLACVGQTLVALLGGLDLSIPFVIGSSNVFLLYLIGLGVYSGIAVIIVLLMGALVGWLNGILSYRLQGQALILTLGMGFAISGLTQIITSIGTAYGGNVFGVVPPWLKNLAAMNGNTLGVDIPPIILIWAVVAVVLIYGMKNTVYGRYLYALGGNRTSASRLSISERRYWVGAYLISGTVSALTGILLLGWSGGGFIGVGQPYLFMTLAAVVIGGTSLLGGHGGYGFTVIGVLVLQVLTSFLIGIGLKFEWQQFIFGLLILPMVALYARSPHIRTQI